MNPDNNVFNKLFSPSLSKADIRKKEIIEMTAKLGGEYGLEKCSFDFIAKKMKITRPLLNHYFKTRELLFEITAEYVRLTIQEKVIENLKMATSADEMLIIYLKTNLNWINQNPNHLKFWLHYMTMSTHDKSCRKKNTSYVEMGQKRISEIINLGIKDKKIKLLIGDSESIARSIQFLITGFLLSFSTENYSSSEIIKQRTNTIFLCCKLLGLSHEKYMD